MVKKYLAVVICICVCGVVELQAMEKANEPSVLEMKDPNLIDCLEKFKADLETFSDHERYFSFLEKYEDFIWDVFADLTKERWFESIGARCFAKTSSFLLEDNLKTEVFARTYDFFEKLCKKKGKTESTVEAIFSRFYLYGVCNPVYSSLTEKILPPTPLFDLNLPGNTNARVAFLRGVAKKILQQPPQDERTRSLQKIISSQSFNFCFFGDDSRQSTQPLLQVQMQVEFDGAKKTEKKDE